MSLKKEEPIPKETLDEKTTKKKELQEDNSRMMISEG